MQQELEKVVSELQLLRLNIIPIYANDDDESERDPEDYIGFYRENIHGSVAAIHDYIRSVSRLINNNQCDNALSAYTDSRSRFIASVPFCYDDLPPVDDLELQHYQDGIRAMFRAEERWSRTSDLESLERFRDLLVELQKLLSLREEGKSDAN